MKLKNKKTGEIVEATDFDILSGYNSLTKFNEEWEDYEEPKECYCIDWTEPDGIYKTTYVDVRDEFNKQIGNCFETKEEAEKAVEKLKAWKRLKDDYHIRFNLDFVKNTISFTYRIDGTLHSVMDDEPIVFEDMKTIFGGEE